jgi:hypothetical protein
MALVIDQVVDELLCHENAEAPGAQPLLFSYDNVA